MDGSGLIDSEEVRAKQLEDLEFRALWEESATARAVALRLVGYRIEHGLTQTALGRLPGMRQPAVVRLEAGDHTPTISTLPRISEALAIEILLDILPANRPVTWGSQHAVAKASVVKRTTTRNGGEMLVAAS